MMNSEYIIQEPEEPIILGKITSSYGIQGWLKVSSFTQCSENIFDYQPWFIKRGNQWQEVQIENWKYSNRNMIVKLESISNRNEADSLNNHEIVISSSRLPKLEGDNYYWKDLIDCRVATVMGYRLGKITRIIETGSNDVLFIKADQDDAFGFEDRLIPFLDEVIKKVDLSNSFIEVDWDPSF